MCASFAEKYKTVMVNNEKCCKLGKKNVIPNYLASFLKDHSVVGVAAWLAMAWPFVSTCWIETVPWCSTL